MVDDSGLFFLQSKRDTVLASRKPNTERELRSFLGLGNSFRNHVRNYATETQPLTALITGRSPHALVQWTPTALNAFETVKRLIFDCHKLYHRKGETLMKLHTDASDYGIGAYLTQMVDRQEQTLAFLGNTLSKVQRRWATCEKEQYAIYYALTTWQH